VTFKAVKMYFVYPILHVLKTVNVPYLE